MIGEREIAPTTLTASVAATSDFSAVDLNDVVAGIQPLYPDYLPFNPTKFSYTWDVNGRVYQDAVAPQRRTTTRESEFKSLFAPRAPIPVAPSGRCVTDEIQQLRVITADLYGEDVVTGCSGINR